MEDSADPYRQLARYYLPLALQAASQSLTYPLVAMVAAQGPGGTLNLAGVMQSNSLMFLVGTLGYGLVTAGLVYGKTRQGYARFVIINHVILLATVILQGLICIPSVSHEVFGTVLGLPPSIELPSTQAFPFTLLLNALFFLRTPYQVLLFNHGASGRASMATFARIGLTLFLAPTFCALGIVGPRWSMVCQIIPVALELFISWHFAHPFIAKLDEGQAPPPSRREILWFNIPLSMGGFLLTLGGWLLGGMLARAAEPERMLPAYYLAIGLANPAAYAASQLRAVVIRFANLGLSDRKTLRFALASGTALGLIPPLFLLPGISDWYYISAQRLPEADLPLVATAAILLIGFPITVGLRAYYEGLAANQHRPRTILVGNVTHIASLMVLGWILLSLHVSGNVLAPLAIVASNLASTAVLRYLIRENNDQPPSLPDVAPGVEGS